MKTREQILQEAYHKGFEKGAAGTAQILRISKKHFPALLGLTGKPAARSGAMVGRVMRILRDKSPRFMEMPSLLSGYGITSIGPAVYPGHGVNLKSGIGLGRESVLSSIIADGRAPRNPVAVLGHELTHSQLSAHPLRNWLAARRLAAQAPKVLGSDGHAAAVAYNRSYNPIRRNLPGSNEVIADVGGVLFSDRLKQTRPDVYDKLHRLMLNKLNRQPASYGTTFEPRPLGSRSTVDGNRVTTNLGGPSRTVALVNDEPGSITAFQRQLRALGRPPVKRHAGFKPSQL